MIEALLIACLACLVVCIVMLWLLWIKQAARPQVEPAAFREINDALSRGERQVREELANNRRELLETTTHARAESTSAAKELRDEVREAAKSSTEALVKSIGELGGLQSGQLDRFAAALTTLTDTNETRLHAIQQDTSDRLDKLRDVAAESEKRSRDDFADAMKNMRESLDKVLTELGENQRTQLTSVVESLGKLTTANEGKMETLRTAVEGKLQLIQQDNSRQLDQMRQTVDERLQGTLEKRLGESFKLVSERLEAVHQGLGEMSHLASNVGDLKKVLANVNARGTWGEVQLSVLLEQVLAPEQYDRNVHVVGGADKVEFAVKLPGRNEERDEFVWLPIDSKFPVEDYRRLVTAHEAGDKDAVEGAAKDLEREIKICAATIKSKYLYPPRTTDFAILFVPTEALFAELLRRDGLCDRLQQEHRVILAGPTTLWSILNSLQMGFRTLAIQKRSSEVWKLLAAIKTEWQKYEGILEKVRSKIQQASNTIDEAKKRTRAIGKTLRDVDLIGLDQSQLEFGMSTDGDFEDPSAAADTAPAFRLQP